MVRAMKSVFDLGWWTKPEWVAVALGIVTLGVVCYQVYLMVRQMATMDSQLEVMKRQDETMSEQTALARTQLELARRQDEIIARTARLRVDSEALFDDGHIRLRIGAVNDGNRGTADFYWYVWVPEAWGNVRVWDPRQRADLGDAATDRFEERSARFRRYQGHIVEAVYPTRRVEIVTIIGLASNAPATFSILWQLAAEDGVFPGHEERGEMVLDVDRLRRERSLQT
jgi:hypothetical protein